MKTIALMDNGSKDASWYSACFNLLKERSGADEVIVLMEGAFSTYGLPIPEDKYARADKMRAAGARLALELPCYCLQGRMEVASFAYALTMQRLDIVKYVAIPYENTEEALLRKIADFLFFEPKTYQNKMAQYRDAGKSPDDVMPEVLEGYVPGAEKALASTLNREAVYALLALKKSYSMIKPLCFAMDELPEVQSNVSDDMQQALIETQEKIRNLLLPYETKEDLTTFLLNHSGGYEKLASLVYNALHQENSADDFLTFSEMAAEGTTTALVIRQHLIQVLHDFKNTDYSMCALFSFVPYFHVVSGEDDSAELLALIKKANWAKIVLDKKGTISMYEDDSLNENRQALLEREF